MRTIWKYTLLPGSVTTVRGGAPTVVHVDADPELFPELPTVWVELEPHAGDANVDLELTFIGTGHQVPNSNDGAQWTHLGSTVCRSVGLVWHVYGTYRIPS